VKRGLCAEETNAKSQQQKWNSWGERQDYASLDCIANLDMMKELKTRPLMELVENYTTQCENHGLRVPRSRAGMDQSPSPKTLSGKCKVRFQVLTAASVNTAVFCFATSLSSLVPDCTAQQPRRQPSSQRAVRWWSNVLWYLPETSSHLRGTKLVSDNFGCFFLYCCHNIYVSVAA
jgi:hypothetical protein